MKKFFILASIMLATVCAQAQLKVNQEGNVSIQTSETAISPLSIGYGGNVDYSAAITGVNKGIYGRRMGIPTTAVVGNPWTYGVCGTNVPNGINFYVGVKGSIYFNENEYIGQGRSFGVLGEAGNATNGYNYGVYGQLNGSKDGAAIVGAIGTSDTRILGRYAGYFAGDVKVTGSIYGTLLSASASANAISAQTALANDASANFSVTNKLAQLSPVQYSLETPVMPASIDGDTMAVAHTMSAMEIQHFEKSHYGLDAAELNEVLPELVYEGQNGELCINYIEMIPLLVESIKELKAEINMLQGGNNGGAVVMTRATYGTTDIEESTALTIPLLKQNNPNPFTENTVIEYSLPETVQTANIYIYDMNGKQIEQIALTERGESSVTVNGGELSAGMYLYSLIADGQVIDTKRMILTK
jgi:hypothetical protein